MGDVSLASLFAGSLAAACGVVQSGCLPIANDGSGERHPPADSGSSQTQPDADTGPVDDTSTTDLELTEFAVTRPDGDPIGYDKTTMLTNIHNIVRFVYGHFRSNVVALNERVGAYCETLGTAGEDMALAQAQEAFRSAMGTWSAAEIMMMGPAQSQGAGLGLRDNIYSWRAGRGPCSVDAGVADASSSSESVTIPHTVAHKGLDALEYLLFANSYDSVCGTAYAPEESPPAEWASIPVDLKAAARCRYSSAVAQQLIVDAEAIMSAWDDYKDVFVAGTFDQGQYRALDGAEQVYHAILLYVDLRIMQLKIFLPYGEKVSYYADDGIDSLCGKQLCPYELEAPFSRLSKKWLLYNLLGMEMLLYGVGPDGSGIQNQGFRNLLHAAPPDVYSEPKWGDPLNGPGIASAIEFAIDRIRRVLQSIPGSLWDDIEAGGPSSDALVDSFHELSLLLRVHIGKGTHHATPEGVTDLIIPYSMEWDS